MGQNYPVSYNGAAPLEYGEGAPRIGVKTIALDTATTDKEYEIGGNIIWVPTASSLDATILIKYQTETNDPIPIQSGSFIAGPSFSRLYISWAAQAGESLTLLYTLDNPKNRFRIENATANYTGVSVTGTVNVDIVQQSDTDALEVQESYPNLYSYTDQVIAAASSVHLFGATTGKRLLLFKNLASNSADFRFGDSGVSATEGFPISPGESFLIPCIGDVYIYNTHPSSSQSIAYIMIRD